MPVTTEKSPNSDINTIKKNLVPGRTYVRKRCGDIVELDATKIHIAMKKAFLAIDPNRAQLSEQLQHNLNDLTSRVTTLIEKKLQDTQLVEIETIQDLVELTLMCEGEHQVARSYILYREQRRKQRDQQTTAAPTETSYQVSVDNNQTIEVSDQWLSDIVQHACQRFDSTNPEDILHEANAIYLMALALIMFTRLSS